MSQIGLWHITDEGPKKLKPSGIDLEKNLENWIEHDPSLLQSGLTIVGRQIKVEGGQLDLLALDAEGQWVVIEIKSEAVRRKTIAQALDYASCIAAMPYDELERKVNTYLTKRMEEEHRPLAELLEERRDEDDAADEIGEIKIFVVGTDRALGLERMAEYLSQNYHLPINVVSYRVFEIDGGQRILARQLTDLEITPPARPKRPRMSVDDICALADRAGLGKVFQTILEAAQRHDIYPRPYKQSIMYTPPSNRTRTLFTVRARPRADGLLRVYVESAAFAEFYPVTEETATEILGSSGWHMMSPSEVDNFVENLDRLFASMTLEE